MMNQDVRRRLSPRGLDDHRSLLKTGDRAAPKSCLRHVIAATGQRAVCSNDPSHLT